MRGFSFHLVAHGYSLACSGSDFMLGTIDYSEDLRADMRIAIYTRTLKMSRGAERVVSTLAKTLAARGHRVDLLLEVMNGNLVDDLLRSDSGVRVRSLEESWWAATLSAFGAAYVNLANLLAALFSLKGPGKAAAWSLFRMTWRDRPPLFSLAHFVWTEKPDVVLSFLNYPNIALLLSARFCGHRTRFVVSVRNHISTSAEFGKSRWMHRFPGLMRRFFPDADGVIVPSEGVAQDVAEITGMARSEIRVIYNPVFRPELLHMADQEVEHPWLQDDDIPVMLAAGKLKPQKDFGNLIRAFACVRSKRSVRLIILGSGGKIDEIVSLAEELGVSDDVDLPGHVENPYPYMKRASVFVLSSLFEGLPNVLIEALACGCPVVSTDCPSGPSEILDRGKCGRLVPVSDHLALADAIEATLENPPSREQMVERARVFSLEDSVAGYERAIRAISSTDEAAEQRLGLSTDPR